MFQNVSFLFKKKKKKSPKNLKLNIPGFIIPQRVVLAIMGFLGIMNAYAMRICLSVAIIEMVKRNPSSGTNNELECIAKEGSTPSVIKF